MVIWSSIVAATDRRRDDAATTGPRWQAAVRDAATIPPLRDAVRPAPDPARGLRALGH